MKRIYAPTYSKWAIEPDGKTLVGYEYNGYKIDIVDYPGARNSMWGATHRWYETTLQSGEPFASDILREVKERIDKEVNSLIWLRREMGGHIE